MKKNEAISILATSLRPREPKDRARYDEAVKMAIKALNCSEIPNSSDTISRQQAIDAVEKSMYENPHENAIIRGMHDHEHRHFLTILMGLPPAQPETCEGCKHLGKWENEVEYGYPSPCTRCKRRVNDNYER